MTIHTHGAEDTYHLFSDRLWLTPPYAIGAALLSEAALRLVAIANLIAGLKGDRLRHCVNPKVYLS